MKSVVFFHLSSILPLVGFSAGSRLALFFAPTPQSTCLAGVFSVIFRLLVVGEPRDG